MKTKIILLILLLILSKTLLCGPIELTDEEKRQLNNQWLKHSYSIQYIPKEEIKRLLYEEKFGRLESLLSGIEDEYENDIRYELKLLRVYENFIVLANEKDYRTLTQIGKWGQQYNSYFAHTARGLFYLGMAQNYRGYDYVSNTSKEKLEKAHLYWDLATNDLKRAAELHERCIPCYDRLIYIGMYAGDKKLVKSAVDKALEINPKLYYLRNNFIQFLQPKWGWTYDDAIAFANQAKQYGIDNPRLWSLRGVVSAEHAYNHEVEENLELAVSKYTEALSYGDKTIWLSNMAYCQYRLADYQGARETMFRVAEYVDDTNKQKLKYIIGILSKKIINKQNNNIEIGNWGSRKESVDELHRKDFFM